MKTLLFIFTLIACIISSIASHASEYPKGFIEDNAYISRDQAFIQALKKQHEHHSSSCSEPEIHSIHDFVRNKPDDLYARIEQQNYAAKVKALETKDKYAKNN